jgi:hypothetical protein
MNVLFNRAIAILRALPVVKFVIVLPDGTEFHQGDLRLIKTKSRNLKYPLGSMCLHYKPYLEKMQPGELIEIPFDKFDSERLRGGICSHCCTAWGNGSVTTAINHEQKCVEVLRLK